LPNIPHCCKEGVVFIPLVADPSIKSTKDYRLAMTATT